MIIEYIPSLVIAIVGIIILIIVYLFWSHVIIIKDTLAHDKFKIILTIISTIASVVFGSAVVLQVLNFVSQLIY